MSSVPKSGNLGRNPAYSAGNSGQIGGAAGAPSSSSVGSSAAAAASSATAGGGRPGGGAAASSAGTASAAPPAAPATVTGLADLKSSSIPLVALREYARQLLVKIFASVPGPKALVIDPSFLGPLGLLAEVQFLKADCGVAKFHTLQPGPLDSEIGSIFYICRPTLEAVRCIGDNIRHQRSLKQKKEYAVYFVPRTSMVVERALEEEGVYDFVTVGSFDVDLIPLDRDVLSLEDPNAFRDIVLNQDRNTLAQIAHSIMRLQSIYGVIPNLKAKGHASKLVLDILGRASKTLAIDHPSLTLTPEIDTLILLDRSVDLVTPMCTQLTYEGLIDEVFGIQYNYAQVEPRLIGMEEGAPGVPPGGKVRTNLNSNDRVFGQIRDMNCAALKPWLRNQAIEIDEYYKKSQSAKEWELSKMRDYMKGLGSYRQSHEFLKIHTNLAAEIFKITNRPSFRDLVLAEQNVLMGNLDSSLKYLEECIDRQENLMKVLRLMVMISLVGGGLKPKQYDFIRKEIIETYGFECLMTLDNLEKCGMLRVNDKRFASSDFATVRKRMNLLVENINEQNPQDPAYVYSGYCPLTTRLVQSAVRPSGWRDVEDVMRLVPGPTEETTQRLQQGVDRVRLDQHGHPRNRVVLVFFVGGCTFTEISTLRFLGRQLENVDFLTATTKIITGDRLLTPQLAPTPVPASMDA